MTLLAVEKLDDVHASDAECARRAVAPVLATVYRTAGTVDILQRYSEDIAAKREQTPGDVGAIADYSRKTIIDAAHSLALARGMRCCERNSKYIGGLLKHVATRSDNEHGRCLDSAQRIAEYVGCGEDVLRDLIRALVSVGALRVEVRPGKAPALWLPYTQDAMRLSANEIHNSIAPPRLPPGRPRKDDALEKAPGASHPAITEKPRALSGKTPGIVEENPGHLMPDSKNSLQELNARGDALAREPRLASPQGSEVKGLGNGVGFIIRALNAQNFACKPEGDAMADWRAGVQRSRACMVITEEEAWHLADWIVRRGEKYWPSAALVIAAVEKQHGEFIWTAQETNMPESVLVRRRHGPFGPILGDAGSRGVIRPVEDDLMAGIVADKGGAR